MPAIDFETISDAEFDARLSAEQSRIDGRRLRDALACVRHLADLIRVYGTGGVPSL